MAASERVVPPGRAAVNGVANINDFLERMHAGYKGDTLFTNGAERTYYAWSVVAFRAVMAVEAVIMIIHSVMLAIIQKVPLILGSSMFYYCLKYVTELTYKNYYKESYEIEHETIEEEIRKSMANNRYQEAVINRYESACRDLGLTEEQKNWLLELLMAEKDRVDEELRREGGGHI